MVDRPLFVELFAGSCQMAAAFRKAGFDTITLDLLAFENVDIVMDILQFNWSMIERKPSVVWASPQCTTYSIAAVHFHRNGVIPKTPDAVIADKVLDHTVRLLKASEAVYMMENPVGMMRKMPDTSDLERRTVNYCQYGDQVFKPTDIWSNDHFSLHNQSGIRFRDKCRKSNPFCHHEKAPRGSKKGVQGKSNNYTRSLFPADLCSHIANFYARKFIRND